MLLQLLTATNKVLAYFLCCDTYYFPIRMIKRELNMKKYLIAALLLSGCASQGVDRNNENQIVKRYYASLESM